MLGMYFYGGRAFSESFELRPYDGIRGSFLYLVIGVKRRFLYPIKFFWDVDMDA